MAVDRETLASVGELVLQTTWLEYLAARMVTIAGRTDNEMALLATGAHLFEHAQETADLIDNTTVREQISAWLAKAETLQGERHTIVHSILLHDGRPGFNVYHPRSGEIRRWSDDEIWELARRVHEHVDEANYMILFDWRQALESLNNSTAMGTGAALAPPDV
jgi:hypothetical protein